MGRARRSSLIREVAVIALLLAGSVTASAKIIYVDDAATGANDGSSWADAYNYLQDALADANSAPKPVEIKAAQGLYTPDSSSAVPDGTGDRQVTFQLINDVVLEGGFAGVSELDPDARDVNAYETILSGDLNGDDAEVTDPCDLLDEPTRNENSYHVVTGSGTDETAVLDGFTITAGNADGSNDQYEGGGMHNSSGNPTVTDCTFSGNSARGGGGMYNCSSNPTLTDCTFSGSSASHGGGVYNWENSDPTLTNCSFLRNWARSGGAIQNNFTSSPELTGCSFTENSAENGGGMYNGSSSSPKLVDCTFSRNRAERGGGGMRNSWLSSPRLTSCIFSENSAQYGGGMVNWDFADAALTDCTFSRNSGTGLYNKNSSPVLKNCIFSENSGAGMFNEDSDLTLTNCAFSENSSLGPGGGMSNLDSSLTLNNCTFTANSALRGGGMSSTCGGFGKTKLTLTNCTFTGNSAVGDFGKGAGMYCSTGSGGEVELTMTNCTFVGNLAIGEHGRGGGMYNDETHPRLNNCVFSENSADDCGGAVYNLRGTPQMSNCRFSGNSAGREGGALWNLELRMPWHEFPGTTLINCIFTENSADDSGGAIYDSGGTPQVSNCRFSGNSAGREGGALFSSQGPSNELPGTGLTNCTFSGNSSRYGGAIWSAGDSGTNVRNCVLWGNTADQGSQVFPVGPLAVEYSDLQGGRTEIPFAGDKIVWGPGNIDVDPGFVQPGYWTEPSPRQRGEPIWIDGDYHLKSEAGRYDPNTQTWVQDDVTSPCIDAGDPMSPIGLEPFPNGGVVNMGSYGGSPEASKSYFGEAVCDTVLAGDINGDCKVDFKDFMTMAAHWLEERE
ncbi:MAG: right-handed parallel beta-helix repeat-containing protein [Phycisphaerales bacterium]|nr:MAG: right-handed parallel beta-helix repeat-containing protein [Phycisphaerales bacterium]